MRSRNLTGGERLGQRPQKRRRRGRTLRGVVTDGTGDDTKNHGSPWLDESRSRGSRDETSNGTRAETDHAPFPLNSVIEETPDGSGESTTEESVPDGHDGTEVGTIRRATVEAQPTEHQHERSKSDIRDVVRTEVDKLALSPASEDPRVRKTTHTRPNFDLGSASEIETMCCAKSYSQVLLQQSPTHPS